MQVVKGRFSFKPEERWRHISVDARDLISKLIVLDPQKRLNIAQVKEHPWCAEAIAKCQASMPKLEKKDESKKGYKTVHRHLFTCRHHFGPSGRRNGL